MADFINIIIYVVFLKCLILGSDFNFITWIEYGKEYWDWYMNRPKFLDKD